MIILVRKALRLVLRWVSLQMRPRLGSRPSENPKDPLLELGGEYEDLLKDLRTTGDLPWALATHGPSQNPANISSNKIKDGVLHSQRIADVISKMAAVEEPPRPTEADLLAQVRKILDEMGHSYSIWYIRLLGYILIKAVRRMYEHIWVNAEVLRDLEPLFSNRDVPGKIFNPLVSRYEFSNKILRRTMTDCAFSKS
jgi:hypothetical protein